MKTYKILTVKEMLGLTLPAIPTAIESKRGTDRRFVDLRIWGWTVDMIPCHIVAPRT